MVLSGVFLLSYSCFYRLGKGLILDLREVDLLVIVHTVYVYIGVHATDVGPKDSSKP